jgi:hypothetical protein
MFWFGPLIIGTKAKCFDLVCLLSKRKQKNLICSENYLSYAVSEGFYLSQKLKDHSKNDSPHWLVREMPTPRIGESGCRSIHAKAHYVFLSVSESRKKRKQIY